MEISKPSNFNWNEQDGIQWSEAEAVTEGKSQLCAMRVEPGSFQPPHVFPETKRTLFITQSGGAQIRIGSKTFRPLPGQTFVVDAGTTFAQTNDTQHPFLAMVLLQGSNPNAEPVWLDEKSEAQS